MHGEMCSCIIDINIFLTEKLSKVNAKRSHNIGCFHGMLYTHTRLEVHIVSKRITHEISLILSIFKKSHQIDFGLKNKRNYINHEYEIDS